MSIGHVTPTKLALIELKEKLRLMRSAKRILEQKRDSLREALKSSIVLLVDIISFLKRNILEILELLYANLIKYEEAVRAYEPIAKERIEVEVIWISKGGYYAPEFRIANIPPIVEYPEGLRAIASKFYEELPNILKLVSSLTELLILLREIEITNRIVNTLEKVSIPSLEERIKYINMMLSEMLLSELSSLRVLFSG
ncbi:MAG: V-type ATP synthase subunit D [Candidatus Korarchaeota archaeon]|nr:hypothetical protein [Thermoproteota archaeon]